MVFGPTLRGAAKRRGMIAQLVMRGLSVNTMPNDLELARGADSLLGNCVSPSGRRSRLPGVLPAPPAAAVVNHSRTALWGTCSPRFSTAADAPPWWRSFRRERRSRPARGVHKTTAIAASVGARVASEGHSCGARVRACWAKVGNPSSLKAGTFNAVTAASLRGHATGLEVK